MSIPPHNASLNRKVILEYGCKQKNCRARNTPYPPNFNKIAARTIEPATGASTWALGSQRCTENIGSFTRKAAKIRKVSKFQAQEDRQSLLCVRASNIIFEDINSVVAQIIIRRRGKEAATV